LNIYIYGNESFKKDITDVLARDSIEEKLDEISLADEDFGRIVKINNLKELKSIIEIYPESIFLIDNKKIIINNIITKFLKFLNPKDGIEKDFLEEHEMAISVELHDVATIAQYVLSKLETYNINEITTIEEIREDDIVSALTHV